MRLRICFYHTAIVFLLSFMGTTSATPLQPSLELEGPGLTSATDGVGLENLGVGTATVTVDIGGPVQWAFLYWAGRDFRCELDASDNCLTAGLDQDLIFDGFPISGVVIGEEVIGPGAPTLSNNIGYRADVTGIVQDAGTGVQSFTIVDADINSNLDELDGATLLVIYTDEAETQSFKFIIFEGLDYAYAAPTSAPVPEAQVTTPVTFNYAAIDTDRDAELLIVTGSADSANRPDRVDISDNPNAVNQLNSTSGSQWDNLQIAISIPGMTASTTVEVVSPAEFGSLSESLLWELAMLRVPLQDEHVANGRFTGGGRQIRVDGVRVTRGLTIHCDLLLSNNLEVNWQGNQFHMTEHLQTVECSDSPDIDQFPPDAPLDTLIGVGTGRYNGQDGFTIEFTLVDAGEPGRDDMAALRIYETLNPGNVALNVPLQVLDGGNLQAHEDQPHR